MNPSTAKRPLTFEIPDWLAGRRLDVALRKKLSPLSRSFLARAVDDGLIRVDGQARRRSYSVRPGQLVAVAQAVVAAARGEDCPEPIRLVYEDEHLLAVNKPAGVITHPISLLTRGGSVVDWLLGHCGCAHLCHRLDRFTSGLILAAKSADVARSMMELFVRRRVSKTYLALVDGSPSSPSGEVTLPLRKDPSSGIRLKMIACQDGVTPARTRYRVVERFPSAALLEVEPKTGRQHQIRAHLAALGAPVARDRLYGPVIDYDYFNSSAGNRAAFFRGWHGLHAASVAFTHPVTAAPMRIGCDVTGPFRAALAELRRSVPGGEGGPS